MLHGIEFVAVMVIINQIDSTGFRWAWGPRDSSIRPAPRPLEIGRPLVTVHGSMGGGGSLSGMSSGSVIGSGTGTTSGLRYVVMLSIST